MKFKNMFYTAAAVSLLISCGAENKKEPKQEEAVKTEVKKEAKFNYQVEQFADIKVLRYQIPGFNELTLKEKKLVYYMTQAGLAGRDIMWDQNYRHNLEIRNALEKINNEFKGGSGKKVNTISLEDYIKSGKGRISTTAKDKIAVIYAQGQIMYGKGNEEIIGQGITNEAIRKARKDKNVKAIVLRVNSPGGSALASELIWRELELAKKEKPLVVSMGNLAASGGYYIACNAAKIVAEPTTITGSIGVFGAVPNFNQFANNIGINAEQVSTNDSPNYSVFEPINQKFYDVTKEGVEDIYKTFVNRVATGRNMTFEQVNEIAQGRVWTGKEALKNGLVDKLGGLNDAIKIAAELAEIDNYRIRNYPNYKKDLKEALQFSPFAKVSKEDILKEALGDESYQLYNNINQMKNLKGVQARIPFIFEVK